MTNDAGYLCAAACDGQGIVQLALPTVADALQAGQLVPVLEPFPLVARWVKIMSPSARLDLLRVKLLFDKMVQHLAPIGVDIVVDGLDRQ
jgi:DNA-binding transcriptional LysR family regulator